MFTIFISIYIKQLKNIWDNKWLIRPVTIGTLKQKSAPSMARCAFEVGSCRISCRTMSPHENIGQGGNPSGREHLCTRHPGLVLYKNAFLALFELKCRR
jgi:hypothetical protein